MKSYKFHISFLVSIFILELLIISNFLPIDVAVKVSILSLFGMGLVYVVNAFVLFPRYFTVSNFKQNIVYIVLSFLLVVVVAIFFTYFDWSISSEFRHPPRKFKYPMVMPFFGRFMWLSVILLVSTFALVVERLIHQVEQTEKAKSDQVKSELKLLKAQINPHFLFNALNNIYSLSYMKSDDAPKSVLRLSNMLRHVLSDEDKDAVDLGAELEYVEDYIAFQRLRIPENVNISFEKEIDNEHIHVPQMLMMPFIENAFKYSRIEEEEEDAFISIFVKSKNKVLHFNIKNNKAKSSVQGGTGMGMNNVKKRLDILFLEKHQLNVIDEQDVFEIDLKIELP